jgi:hypothetical protein
MEYLIVDVFIPLVIAIVLITTVFTVVRIILDIFHIGIYVIRILCFFIAYYFVGEYVFNIVQKYIAGDMPDFVRLVYMPVQVILNYLNINI